MSFFTLSKASSTSYLTTESGVTLLTANVYPPSINEENPSWSLVLFFVALGSYYINFSKLSWSSKYSFTISISSNETIFCNLSKLKNKSR